MLFFLQCAMGKNSISVLSTTFCFVVDLLLLAAFGGVGIGIGPVIPTNMGSGPAVWMGSAQATQPGTVVGISASSNSQGGQPSCSMRCHPTLPVFLVAVYNALDPSFDHLRVNM
jgi:hypothetical protein